MTRGAGPARRLWSVTSARLHSILYVDCMRHLLPGETLVFDQEADDSRLVNASDEEIATRYTSGEYRIVTEQARTALPELPGILKSERYVLRPDFQRRHRWDEGRQSRLIESFIMNVPVPPIFLYEFQYSRYEVMDGLQRLTALDLFYKDELVLTELEYWKELEGRTYSRLPLQLKQAIDRRYMSSIILLYETAGDPTNAQGLKELVFERINSGGVRLTAQESRNALSSGPLNEAVQKLARDVYFCRAWGIPEPDQAELMGGQPRKEVREDPRYQSMEDAEMVLRFFAHRQRGDAGVARRLKLYLDTFWVRANSTFTPELMYKLSALFHDTSRLVYEVLGEAAFYVRRDRAGGRGWVPRPTLLAYDAVMSAFSQHVEDGERLIQRREEVQRALEQLYDDHAAEFDGRRTDPRDVQARDELIRKVLSETIDAS